MLTSVSDVKAYAKRRYLNFDYTVRYPDAVITDIISECQQEIELETGYIFDKQSVSQDFFNETNRNLLLDHYPVISVESLTIDGTAQDITSLRLNQKSGIIYLEEPHPYVENEFDATVGYTVGYEPTHPQAKAVCNALVVYTMFMERETPPSLQTLIGGNNENSSSDKLQTNEKMVSVVFDITSRLQKLPHKGGSRMV